jgi:hypothetical protein
MNRAAAALAALALGVSACGGDDAPSKADLERVCNDASKYATSLGKGASTPDEFAQAIDKVIEDMRSSMDELRELETPDGDTGETAEQFVKVTVSDTEDEGIPALEDFRDALKDNDEQGAQAAYKRLQEVDTKEADRLAGELGARDCVS